MKSVDLTVQMKKDNRIVLIREYYKSENFSPELPRYPQWRHFRYKSFTKERCIWRKAYKQLRNTIQLKQNVVDRDGIDLYYSTSLFLNPKNIGLKQRRGGYAVDCLILLNDIILDFDPVRIDIECMEMAKREALDAIKRLGLPDRFIFTGRGFRLDYFGSFLKPNFLKMPNYSVDVIDFLSENRKLFIKALPKYKTLDTQITTNPLSVVRIVGSVNSKTGYLCTDLPRLRWDIPMIQLLQDVPFVTKERPVIPNKVDDRLPRRSIASGIERPGQSSATTYFIESTVVGLKGRHILIAELNNKTLEKDIKKVIDMYGLGEILIIKTGAGLQRRFAVCLTSLQCRRMQKVMRALHASNEFEITQFRMSKLPLYKQGGEVKIKLSKRIKSGHNNRFISRGHLVFLQSIFPNRIADKYPKKHGTLEVMQGLALHIQHGKI